MLNGDLPQFLLFQASPDLILMLLLYHEWLNFLLRKFSDGNSLLPTCICDISNL